MPVFCPKAKINKDNPTLYHDQKEESPNMSFN